MEWVERIESAARSTLGGLDRSSLASSAQAVTRRRTADLLLGALGHEDSPPQVDLPPRATLDERLLAARAGWAEVPRTPDHTEGPLTPRSSEDVIEVWTEIELSAVHSAWLIPAWRVSAERSAFWLLEEIQPDNATNLPWAVHVFAWLAVVDGSQEARLYAETLLHHCSVARGRPDALSAVSLVDAAAGLRNSTGP